jgi:hypothetical protein
MIEDFLFYASVAFVLLAIFRCLVPQAVALLRLWAARWREREHEEYMEFQRRKDRERR